MEKKFHYTTISCFFGDTGVVFTLKGYILSMITDYEFNETNSPDAKQIVIFLDKMHLEQMQMEKF